MPYKHQKYNVPAPINRVKLSPEQRNKIVQLHKTKGIPYIKLAAFFKVSVSTIQGIVNPEIAERRKQIAKKYAQQNPDQVKYNNLQHVNRKQLIYATNKAYYEKSIQLQNVR